MTFLEWYTALEKPSWTPAPETIRTIWWILYPIIITTYAYIFIQVARGKIPRWVALPFALNLLFNLAFMPLQASLRNLTLASVDIVLVWLTLVWAILAAWPHARWVSLAQIPYLIWVSIATVLQLLITAMNPER
jgi:tryptophan-rich sensory protein